MPTSVLLCTDRPAFESQWRSILEQHELAPRAIRPDRFGKSVERGLGAVIDSVSAGYDEDELLATLGLAAAVGAVAAVHLPGNGEQTPIEDVLDDVCQGLIARTDSDIVRVATTMARRLDRDRGRRFEFVTVSPRPEEVLAILGDGRTALLPRPVADGDDGSDIVSIELSEDASTATLELGTGRRITLRAAAIAQATDPRTTTSNGAIMGSERLGARLRELRMAAGLTQAELARRTGIHRPNIARVEAGRHTPSLDTLSRLATAIGVPTTRVLSGE